MELTDAKLSRPTEPILAVRLLVLEENGHAHGIAMEVTWTEFMETDPQEFAARWMAAMTAALQEHIRRDGS